MPKGVALNLDWEQLELEYVGGNKSLKQIADKYGISWGALRSRANRFKWNRKSADAIIEKAHEKVVQSLVERRIKEIQELEDETVPIAKKLQKGVEHTFDSMNGQELEPSELQGLAMALKTANAVARLNLGAVDPGQRVDITSGGLPLHERSLELLASCKKLVANGQVDPATIDVEAIVKSLGEEGRGG